MLTLWKRGVVIVSEHVTWWLQTYAKILMAEGGYMSGLVGSIVTADGLASFGPWEIFNEILDK